MKDLSSISLEFQWNSLPKIVTCTYPCSQLARRDPPVVKKKENHHGSDRGRWSEWHVFPCADAGVGGEPLPKMLTCTYTCSQLARRDPFMRNDAFATSCRPSKESEWNSTEILSELYWNSVETLTQLRNSLEIPSKSDWTTTENTARLRKNINRQRKSQSRHTTKKRKRDCIRGSRYRWIFEGMPWEFRFNFGRTPPQYRSHVEFLKQHRGARIAETELQDCARTSTDKGNLRAGFSRKKKSAAA